MESNIIYAKPEIYLSGKCQISWHLLKFGSYDLIQENNKLFYDNDKFIDLNDCCHVELMGKKSLKIHLKKSRTVIMKFDEKLEKWLLYLPQWISHIRQIPLWQILVNFSTLTPISWGYKKNPVGDWDSVFFRLIDSKLYYYHNERKTNENHLGSINIDNYIVIVENAIKLGNWTIAFETKILAQKWYKSIFNGEANLKRSQVELPEETLKRMTIMFELENDLVKLNDLLGGVSKQSNKNLIDMARMEFQSNSGKSSRRNSLESIEWSDEEDDGKNPEYDQVMNLLKFLADNSN